MAVTSGVLRGKENNPIREPRDSDTALSLPMPWTKQTSLSITTSLFCYAQNPSQHSSPGRTSKWPKQGQKQKPICQP